jgi:hypothetical protein
LPLPPTFRSASIRSALPHGLHLLDLAHWGLENEAQGEWPPRELSAVELPVGYLAGRSRVLQWLLSKPNGPSPKEQEQTLLLELHTGAQSTAISRRNLVNPFRDQIARAFHEE